MDGVRGLDDLDFQGKRVLVRSDLNAPLNYGGITDDTRIREALPTLRRLLGDGASVVLITHVGRPHGVEPQLSVWPIAQRLAKLLGSTVIVASGTSGPAVKAEAERLLPGQVLLLENIRYEPGETVNDPELASFLASLGDFYVNDAFGAAHRAHASTAGVAALLPSAAGLLLEKEVATIEAMLDNPMRPLVAIVGGSKVSDKIAVLERFLDVADRVLIGGAMVFPLLKASGHSVGGSLCADADADHATAALAKVAAGCHATLELPVDLVLGREFSAETEVQQLDGVDVPDGWMGLDIGPVTAATYAQAARDAGTVFWNGPMGAFELDPFAAGTRTVAEGVAESAGMTVIGGGDSAAAIAQFGLSDEVDWISTGGGAAMELIEGRKLPGVEALR
ncbi:MAG: phosphoglycerate kinase [Solirubrobacterales bacterium]|nr:phosphoglycerate kinase [Solirubrobacterales bacterium]